MTKKMLAYCFAAALTCAASAAGAADLTKLSDQQLDTVTAGWGGWIVSKSYDYDSGNFAFSFAIAPSSGSVSTTAYATSTSSYASSCASTSSSGC